MAYYIESYQDLGRHPKTTRLSKLLGISKVTVVGHLQYLWWWCLDYAPDGDLSKYDSAEIADGALWEGDADAFLQALQDARFVDVFSDGQGIAIHDWDKYGGKLIQRRKADAERKSAARTKDSHTPSAGSPPEVRRKSDVEKRREEKLREEKKTAREGATATASFESQRLGHIDDEPAIDRPFYTARLKGRGATEEEIRVAEATLKKRNAPAKSYNDAYMWPIIRDYRDAVKKQTEEDEYASVPSSQKPNVIRAPASYRAGYETG